MNNKTTIYIVDDDRNTLDSLKQLLESLDFQVKTYPTADSFLKSYASEQKGCLILDMRMPNMSGLELQEELIRRKIAIPIIFISGHGDISMVVRAIKNGAFDFLAKPLNHQILLEAINKALKQDQQYRTKSHQTEIIQARAKRLTPREQQVMKLMVAGCMNKVIAKNLGITPSTVELHRAKVMQKMEVRNLAELVKLTLIHELIKSDNELSIA